MLRDEPPFEPPHHDARWHLDKRISVGHLITTLTVVVSVVIWSLQLQAKITVVEVRIEGNEQSIADVRSEVKSQYTEIIRRLERLDEKIDQ